MSSLPEALRPWATQLALFPEDLALSLGTHVARLAAALGPLRARNEQEGGELQGYDGLTRRGSPERLLMSEWLMALEAPDEFVRRAAFGEQAYLRPAFRQPQGGRRTVALLDAGPDQLGSPRIVHLALLVVLARRAEAAGVGFSWAVLQSSPQTVPFSTVDDFSIGRWLKAGSAEPPTEARLVEWCEALEPGRAPDDVWLVGGARLSRLPSAERLSRVAVEEVIAPGARRLQVEVWPSSRAARQVVLELPPEPQCVRLLRDPFSTAVAPPVLDTQHVRAIRFSADGLRLLLAHGEGSVAAQALPQSPRATSPRPKRFHPPYDETLVAAGWRRSGGLFAVTLRERTLRVHGQLRGYTAGHPLSFPLPEGAEPPRLPRPGEPPLLAMSQVYKGRESVGVLDAAGALHQLRTEGNTPTVTPIASQVTALAEREGHIFYVFQDPTQPRAEDQTQLGCWGPQSSWRESLRVRAVGAAYFGHARASGAQEPGPLAVLLESQVAHHQWMAIAELKYLHKKQDWVTSELLSPLRELRVVGMAPSLSDPYVPGLVVLGTDRRTFYLLTRSGTEFLMSASSEVVAALVSHAQPLLAWVTREGHVEVWSFPYRAFVYRSAPGGTA